MEFGLREWGILLGVIAVIAVLYDGWRRTRQSSGDDLPFKFPNDEGADEKRDPLTTPDNFQPDIFKPEPDFDSADIGKTGDLDFGDISPPRPKNTSSVPAFDADPEPAATPIQPPVPSPMNPTTPPTPTESIEPEVVFDENDGMHVGGDYVSAPRPKVSPAEPETPPNEPQAPLASDVLVMFVRPQKGVFKGVDLRNALVAMGLSYGEQSLYHRHSGGSREVLYTVANASSEGSFPEGTMEGFTSPGVVIMMDLSQHADPEHGFEEMVSSARQMCRRLSADLLDSNQQPLEKEFLASSRNRVKELAKARRADSRRGE